MKLALNRRSFLKRSALAAGALSAVRLLPVPNILAAARPGREAQLRPDRLRGTRHDPPGLGGNAEQGQPGGDRGRRREESCQGEEVAGRQGPGPGPAPALHRLPRDVRQDRQAARRCLHRHAQPSPRACRHARHATGQRGLLREAAHP